MNQSYPVLPLRDIVVFPHMIVPLFVGRDKSVAALEAAMAADKEIFLVAQLDPAEDDPTREDLYEIGGDEYLYGEGICVVEWADLVLDALPEDSLVIRITYGKQEGERIYQCIF